MATLHRDPTRPLLTLGETAEFLGISEPAVLRLLAFGDLAAHCPAQSPVGGEAQDAGGAPRPQATQASGTEGVPSPFFCAAALTEYQRLRRQRSEQAADRLAAASEALGIRF